MSDDNFIEEGLANSSSMTIMNGGDESNKKGVGLVTRVLGARSAWLSLKWNWARHPICSKKSVRLK